jgi:hypothetical protein
VRLANVNRAQSTFGPFCGTLRSPEMQDGALWQASGKAAWRALQRLSRAVRQGALTAAHMLSVTTIRALARLIRTAKKCKGM